MKTRVVAVLSALILAGCLYGSDLRSDGTVTFAPTRHDFPGIDLTTSSTWLNFTATEPSGAIITALNAQRGAMVDISIDRTWDVSEYRPIHLVAVAPDGGLRNLLDWDMELSHFGYGEGVVAAGAGSHDVETPAVASAEPLENGAQGRFELPFDGGWLVASWANLDGPFSMALHWHEPVAFVALDHGAAMAFELKDFDGGAYAVSPGPGASILGTIGPMGESTQILINARFFISDAGRGSFRANAADREISLALDGAPDASCMGCYRDARAMLIGRGPAEMSVEYLGWTGQTKILGVTTLLNPDIVPVSGARINEWDS